jgi:hypothetical protein
MAMATILVIGKDEIDNLGDTASPSIGLPYLLTFPLPSVSQ